MIIGLSGSPSKDVIIDARLRLLPNPLTPYLRLVCTDFCKATHSNQPLVGALLLMARERLRFDVYGRDLLCVEGDWCHEMEGCMPRNFWIAHRTFNSFSFHEDPLAQVKKCSIRSTP